jgi:hypothetical protein
MSDTNKSRSLTKEEKSMLLNLKQDEITLQKLQEFFATTEKHKPLFSPIDKFNLEKNEYYNKEPMITTVGRLIVNKVLLEPELIKHLGYQNIVIDNGSMKGLDESVMNLMITGEIDDIQIIHDYLDRCNWLGYAPASFINSSLTTELYLVDEKIKKRKAELIEQYKEEIQNNDVDTINMIEKELLNMARELIKDDPGYMVYDSKCRGSFDNNYKNSVICRGAIKDFADPSQFNSSMASLTEGIPKEDFDKYANIMTAGTYARAKNTEKGGYLSKQVNSGMQHLMIDNEQDSDCGSTKYLSVNLSKSNYKLFMYRFIKGKDDDNLILLDPDTIGKYIGKTVKMRSPMYCKGDKICNHCAGDLFRRLNLNNAGLMANRASSTLQSKSMKQFHDSTIKVSQLSYLPHISEI